MVVLGGLSALRGATQLPTLALAIAVAFGVGLEVLRRGAYKAAANLAFVVLLLGRLLWQQVPYSLFAKKIFLQYFCWE